MLAGLGTATMGSAPFGAGTPTPANVPPEGTAELANFIDQSGDYVVAEDGSYQRMPVVRQQVLLLLRTELGSAAHEPEVGLELPQKMDQSFEQRARGAVLSALEPIGDDIRIDAIPVERIPTGRADITVEYTDLTTGNADTLTL